MKSNPVVALVLLGIALLGLTAAQVRAEKPAEVEKPKLDDFLRFVEDEDSGRLQTSVARYTNEDGASVELVGAVHIGDAEYYAELNEVFAGYESLLFEMIGGKDDLKKKDMQGTGAIRMLQGMMGRTLELDFQLDGVDYTAENFVHADMDAATFSKRMSEQKISLFALMNKVSKVEQKRAMERAKKGLPPQDLGMAAVIKALLFGGGKDLKMSIGRQFGELNSLLGELDEESGVIIGERNAVALEVLAKELEAGKKDIGIFYGAAHMPDMEEKLAEMGFRRTGIEWKTAWFMAKKEGAKRDAEKAEVEGAEKEEALLEK